MSVHGILIKLKLSMLEIVQEADTFHSYTIYELKDYMTKMVRNAYLCPEF